jgi:hypothetical protein
MSWPSQVATCAVGKRNNYTFIHRKWLKRGYASVESHYYARRVRSCLVGDARTRISLKPVRGGVTEKNWKWNECTTAIRASQLVTQSKKSFIATDTEDTRPRTFKSPSTVGRKYFCVDVLHATIPTRHNACSLMALTEIVSIGLKDDLPSIQALINSKSFYWWRIKTLEGHVQFVWRELSMMRKQAVEVYAYRELREVLTLKEWRTQSWCSAFWIEKCGMFIHIFPMHWESTNDRAKQKSVGCEEILTIGSWWYRRCFFWQHVSGRSKGCHSCCLPIVWLTMHWSY